MNWTPERPSERNKSTSVMCGGFTDQMIVFDVECDDDLTTRTDGERNYYSATGLKLFDPGREKLPGARRHDDVVVWSVIGISVSPLVAERF